MNDAEVIAVFEQMRKRRISSAQKIAPATEKELQGIGIDKPLHLKAEGLRGYGVDDAPTHETVPVNAERLEKAKASPRTRRESYLPEVMRPLPQSMDAEMGVLGSIMLASKKVMYQVEGIVGPSHFHHPANRTIFQAFQELHADNEPFDLISITNYLEKQGKLDEVGGAAYVTSLFTFIPTASNVGYYMEILCAKYKLREAYSLCQRGADAALLPGQEDTIDSMLQSISDGVRKIQDAGDANSGIEVHSFSSIMDFDTKNDADSVLGYRYLCRGGSALIVGQSGIGKSSLAMQQAMMWGQGKEIFGLGPTHRKPLKCLFIQAENDKGDLAEMMQGVMKAYPIPEGMTQADFIGQMQQQMVFARDTIHTGADFARCAARLVQKNKPDLVFVDPLLSYAGDDISSQKVASHFLRNTLNPIAHDTGIIWMLLHHTGKPSTDPKAKAHWTDHDFSYAAFGSSELVNWARAVMVLRSIGESRFELRFSKRGKRTGVKEFQDPDHIHTQPAPFTDVVYMQHAKDAIYWEQIEKPAEMAVKVKDKKTGQFEKRHGMEKILRVMKKAQESNTPLRTKHIQGRCEEDEGMSKATFYRIWDDMQEAKQVIPDSRDPRCWVPFL